MEREEGGEILLPTPPRVDGRGGWLQVPTVQEQGPAEGIRGLLPLQDPEGGWLWLPSSSRWWEVPTRQMSGKQ